MGGNATASGADSNGILIDLDITPGDDEEGTADSGSTGTSNKEPVRIEVLGTVDGGADGNDLLIRVTDCNAERVYDDPDDPTMGIHDCDFFVKVTLNRQLTIFRAAQPPKKVISSRKLFPL